MGAFKDLTGKRFGRLTVINRAPTRNKGTYWNCLCDCGNTKIINSGKLTSGNTRLITHDGVTESISNWARKVNVRSATLRARIFNYGWDVERALTEGVK